MSTTTLSPPRDIESEAAVLGAILIDPAQLDAAQEITTSDFYDTKHAVIFSAMHKLRRDETQIDIVTLRSELDRTGKMEDIGGVEYLVRLGDAVPDASNAAYYAARVRETANNRRLIDASERLAHAIGTGGMTDLAAHDLKAALAAIEAARPNRSDITPISAGSLITENPDMNPPVIEGIVRVGETANLIAPPKSHKTYTSQYIALSINTGKPLFGQLEVSQGRVLYLDAELHQPTFAKRLEHVAQGMGIDFMEYADLLDIVCLRGKLKDFISLGSFFRSIEKGYYKLIIIDAAYRFMPADFDENSNADMAKIYNLIDQYAASTGSAFLIIHHASKGVQSEKSVTDMGAGAGAQSRAADAHIVMRQHEEDGAIVLEAANRSFAPLAPLCLRWQYPVWSPAPDLDPSKLRTSNRRHKADDKPKATEWTAELFAGAFASEKPSDKETILAKAGRADISDRQAKKLFALAVDGGLIHAWSRKRANEQIKYAIVPEPSTPQT